MGQRLSILVTTCAAFLASIIINHSDSSADQNLASPQTTAQAQPTVAGVPADKARAIFDRHRKDLMRMPGVYEVGLGEDGILLAIYVHSNSRTIDPQALQKAVAALPVTVEGIPTKILPLAILPPPPGVVILRADGTGTQADSCPEGFREMKKFSWQLCIDPGFRDAIPALMEPPLAGLPFEQVEQIYERHQEELRKLPGVDAVGLEAEGIHVYTDKPELVPKEIEGVPVKVSPRLGPGEEVNHTVTSQVRPLHGSVALLDFAWIATAPNSWGTLTGIALSDGKPWLIFPAHLINQCQSQTVPCPVPSQGNASLSLCPHYGNPKMVQPPQQNYGVAGYTQRWTPPVSQSVGLSVDVAAAFMDNNTIEGDGSLSANRTLENSVFTGLEISPMLGQSVVVGSPQDPGGISHTYLIKLDSLDFFHSDIQSDCGAGTTILTAREHQILLEQIPGQRTVQSGDSGSAILANGIVGMVNWRVPAGQGQPALGGGTRADTIRLKLGFDAWYGTQTVKDNTIGVFRPSAATWYVDNGNGKYDGCTSAPPTTTSDQCFTYGISTDVPITGDWDNAAVNSPSNDFTVGLYRLSDPNVFYLSNTNNPPSTVVPLATGPASFGYKPVTGKWQGNGASNATSKVGVFRPSTGGWYLEGGNQMVDGCGNDYCFFLAAGMYQLGDIPIAGDWNGDGIVSIGLFRPGVGGAPDYFFLSNVNPFDVRFNGTIFYWDYAIPGGPGNFGYLPVTGNWTGMTRSGVGVFKSGAGTGAGGWYLDNGNLSFSGCAEDQCPVNFGLAGDKPVAFGKSIVKAN